MIVVCSRAQSRGLSDCFFVKIILRLDMSMNPCSKAKHLGKLEAGSIFSNATQQKCAEMTTMRTIAQIFK